MDNNKPQNDDFSKFPLSAWFLGPKAENSTIWKELFNYVFDDYIHWRRNYFPKDPIIVDRITRRKHENWYDKLTSEIDEVLNQLKLHYPFYSPRYIAHMLSEQSLPAVLGYFAGMLYNPNNVTDEAAPVTVPLEIEVGRLVSKMLGYNPKTSWTHITSGGTVANIEALWVARTVQFSPLIVKEYCKENGINFKIKLPDYNHKTNKYEVDIRKVSNKRLINLKPNEAIFMFRKLANFLINTSFGDEKKVIESINNFINKSQWNISKTGFSSILKRLRLTPKIFVSASAHYSIKKAANILGYGENNVILVPVQSNFKMDIETLSDMIFNLKKNEYIAAVVGIMGSTEEGAIDPLHEIKFLRDKLQKEKKISFWFHVDAAWGGYIKSLFNLPDSAKSRKKIYNLNQVCEFYKKILNIKEQFDIKLGKRTLAKNLKIEWGNDNNYKAILALGDSDSITIDPHKLGYIPYPAGMISFKNAIVTEHIQQKAQYISDDKGGIKNLDKIEIKAIGPYILEGSKPGAAAAATWLAHKVIPLETHGHGKIIRTTLLNTLKFSRYLDFHKNIFNHIDKYLFGEENYLDKFFTFKYLYTPDTNVICFIIIPMKLKDGKLDNVDVKLSKLNYINKQLYARLTINELETPYKQDFFVSRTTFEKDQYSFESLKLLLDRLHIKKAEYNRNGLFVLRSTIMNPWHWKAQLSGIDYLMEFILYMHKIGKEII